MSIASSSGTPSSSNLSKGTGERVPPLLFKYGLDGGGDGADSDPWKGQSVNIPKYCKNVYLYYFLLLVETRGFTL